MKKVIVSLLFVLLLFNSCIVKSLHPFYTKDSITFENKFIGNWKDNNKGTWSVVSFKDYFLKNKKVKRLDDLSENQLKEYKKFQNSYIATLSDSKRKSVFRVFPFKINEQLFLDFSILELDSDEIGDLASMHLVGVHSLAKLDFESNNKIIISWFDEEKLSNLLEENRIKIKHEKIEEDGRYVLTASSIELQNFIKNYMNSDIQEKWKTDIKYILERKNE